MRPDSSSTIVHVYLRRDPMCLIVVPEWKISGDRAALGLVGNETQP